MFLFTTKLQRSLGRPGSAQVALLGGHGTQAEAALRVPLALGSKGKSPGWAWATGLQPWAPQPASPPRVLILLEFISLSGPSLSQES